jgi:hypothetical protein
MSPRRAEHATGEAARPGRDPGAPVLGMAGAVAVLVAQLVMVAASLIVLLIVLAIVLYDVNASGANTLVRGIHEGANLFAGAFTGLVGFDGHAKWAITLGWGIALPAYMVLAEIVSRAIANVGLGGVPLERRRSMVAGNY